MGIPGTPFSAGGEVKKAGASRPWRLGLVLGVAVPFFLRFFRDECAFPNCLGVNPVITAIIHRGSTLPGPPQGRSNFQNFEIPIGHK